ncbi:neprilysin-4-like isoform X1 [Dermacentor silvarum]|uniref:neprilysin-4-like isoform X1 n=1 Tax=Dermacentor silvarum TaxID=543639 RepID=UPI002100AD02|nr:neprilysin-4-like isoform X1 [Dermacentor silvarum]
MKNEFKRVNITFKDTDTFSVYYNYYKLLNRFLATANPNTLYNYAGFLKIFPYVQYINMSTAEAITKARNWTDCIALLNETTPDILDYFFVTYHTNPAVKNEVETIARRLKQAFNKTLQNNSWIENKILHPLQKQLEKVELKIGYPDTLLNISVLETRYKYVPFFPLNISLTEALYYIQENLYKMRLRKFRYPREGDLGWDHSPRERRTFQNFYWTKIEIPYALFESPFYQQGLPRSFNYGGIGSIIARELARGFSLKGIHRCTYGRCDGPTTKETLTLLMEKTDCFMTQYREVDKELLLNVPESWYSETLSEDLADNTGLQRALNAYNNVLDEECEGLDTRIKGLQRFSGMQLFFISSARTMCRIADKDTLFQVTGNPVFSTARNRVNEPMKNLQEFAKAFNCSIGSRMHPSKNCSWL